MIALSFIVCFLWLWLSQRMIVQWGLTGIRQSIFCVTSSLIAIWLSAPSLWQAAWQGYPNDSFFDLSFFGRAGVLTISSSLIVLFYLLMHWKSRVFFQRKGKTKATQVTQNLADLSLSMVLFGVFYAISPQVYYTFYQFIFPDLPIQIVIKSIFDVSSLITIAAFCADDTLSHHLAGLAFLGLLPFTLLRTHYEAAKFPSATRPIFYVTILIISFSLANLNHC